MEDKKDAEIDLLKLGERLWHNKKDIIKVTIVGIIIGLVIAFSIPKEYTSSIIFTVNSSDTKAGNMGALASLAGLNVGGANSSSDVFSPELYPNIINSTSFIRGLFEIEVKDSTQGIDTLLYSYLDANQKTSWWSVILKAPSMLTSLFNSKKQDKVDFVTNPYYISNDEMKVIEILKNSYSITTDKKSGITTFEITSQSPVIAAFLADTITSYLQSYIIQERTKKAQADLENSYRLYKQYKENYDLSQQRLAIFVDRNKNIISEAYRFNQKKLENEASLAYAVYNQMAQQVQMNEIKIQDDTPVFTIIQPAIEPLYPSQPKKKIILIGGALVFFLCSCFWVLRGDIFSLLKKE